VLTKYVSETTMPGMFADLSLFPKLMGLTPTPSIKAPDTEPAIGDTVEVAGNLRTLTRLNREQVWYTLPGDPHHYMISRNCWRRRVREAAQLREGANGDKQGTTGRLGPDAGCTKRKER